MKIQNISGNKVTVIRGSNSTAARTTALNPYGLTGATSTNYLISPNEEFDFSRTLYCSLPDSGFTNGLKIVDGSGNSLADSDEYGAHLLGDTWKEASYVLRPFHLAMAYDINANRISLFLDGKELDTEIFSEGIIRFASIVGDGAIGTVDGTVVFFRRSAASPVECHEELAADAEIRVALRFVFPRTEEGGLALELLCVIQSRPPQSMSTQLRHT